MTHLPDPDFSPEFYQGTTSKRFLAWIIDVVLIFLVSGILVVFTAFLGALVWPILYLTVSFFYRTLTLASGSATWGMQFAGVELRDRFGHRFDFGTAILHTLGYLVSVSFPILQVVSVVVMLTSSRGQGLTDMILGTAAVNRRMA
ncbi:RDD family protein [Chachezhania sediminis]|uniref:RDD family protein n=1 Tax=Chachezhania sediminis TaxID=2599291 RepID=UPI00131EAE37|nr:RDD family protein [Chachezhania sediminis]